MQVMSSSDRRGSSPRKRVGQIGLAEDGSALVFLGGKTYALRRSSSRPRHVRFDCSWISSIRIMAPPPAGRACWSGARTCWRQAYQGLRAAVYGKKYSR